MGLKVAVVVLFLIVIGLGFYSYQLNTRVNDLARDLNQRLVEKEDAISAFDTICEFSESCEVKKESGESVVGKLHCWKYTEDLKTREFCIQDLNPKSVDLPIEEIKQV